MKTIIFIITLFSFSLYAQDVAELPRPLGAGSAEVYNGKIYFFGGSNNWSGTLLYDTVYVYNGTNWAVEDTIPDRNLWDVETVRIGNEVYLVSGWPGGANFLRKYNLDTKEWTYLANSPNATTWGVAAEYVNGFIYLFAPNGNVWAYSVWDNMWETKSSSGYSGPLNLSSIVYNDEIYVIGYNDSVFVKYNPTTDIWTPLAKSLYQVGASAMGIINDQIYCVGGNSTGQSTAQYKSIIVYNATENEWKTDSLQIGGKRHWMATAEYEGGLYVLGGIDSTAQSVRTVEEIVPQGTAVNIAEEERSIPGKFRLFPNYPNPFNPTTILSYELSEVAEVSMDVFDIKGRKVTSLLKGVKQQPGVYNVVFDATGLVSGIYFSKIIVSGTINSIFSQKMILLK